MQRSNTRLRQRGTYTRLPQSETQSVDTPVTPQTTRTLVPHCVTVLVDGWRAGACVWHPYKGNAIRNWDIFISSFILCCCFILPYEIAFLTLEEQNSLGFDQCVVPIFAVDVLLQFVIAFPDESSEGMRTWVSRPTLIILNYLGSWFVPDLISILPLDEWLTLAFGGHGNLSFIESNFVQASRCAKLIRLFRFGRLYQRWHELIPLSFVTLTVLVDLVLVVLFVHWAACFWGFMGILFTGLHTGESGWSTWLLRAIADKHLNCEWYEVPHYSVYWMSCYWAMCTVTSVGYGDIAASNLTEYAISTVIIFVGAFIWAYVLGTVTTAISSLDPHTIEFERDLDDLHLLVQDKNLDSEMRTKLRTYMYQSRGVRMAHSQKKLLELLSPGLQGQLALLDGGIWIPKVWYLQDLYGAEGGYPEVVVEVARRLDPIVFSEREAVYLQWTLFIIQRGIGIRKSKLLHKGEFWGEDMILDSAHLIDSCHVTTITHMQVLQLSRTSLDEVGEIFPKMKARFRRAQIRLAVFRGFIAAAKELRRKRMEAQLTGEWVQAIADLDMEVLSRGNKPRGNRAQAGVAPPRTIDLEALRRWARLDLRGIITDKVIKGVEQAMEEQMELFTGGTGGTGYTRSGKPYIPAPAKPHCLPFSPQMVPQPG
mmetsp:Transcript_43506/g.114803  ORF Transcript_43506/g.114803 Transcript_43506/m.114803 type:complete len:651 (-) Transcript_43506:31-1983(-)